MADKHIISLISMIVGSIAVAVILRLIGPDSTIFQISLFTGLAGFLVGFLGGWCFHHWSYSSQHMALECQRIALERLKEENQEKQRQWERDRAEPTAAQKIASQKAIHERFLESLEQNNLHRNEGHIVNDNGQRVCPKCFQEESAIVFLVSNDHEPGPVFNHCPWKCPVCGARYR